MIQYVAVLPADAGMFPGSGGRMPQGARSPRVCGDVSSKVAADLVKRLFSPRMRGCFLGRIIEAQGCGVLPAYAGMFPGMSAVLSGLIGSPRVCGDVSRCSSSWRG